MTHPNKGKRFPPEVQSWSLYPDGPDCELCEEWMPPCEYAMAGEYCPASDGEAPYQQTSDINHKSTKGNEG